MQSLLYKTKNFALASFYNLQAVSVYTIKERFDIIHVTKQKALKQMEDLKKQLELLDYKENFYKNLIKHNLKDSWNPMNKTAPEEAAI